jgi:hypothetical protein
MADDSEDGDPDFALPVLRRRDTMELVSLLHLLMGHKCVYFGWGRGLVCGECALECSQPKLRCRTLP